MSETLLGSITVTKRLRGNAVWERKDYGYCWLDLLLLANDQERETFIQGEKVLLKRGQLAWSLRSLEKEWDVSGEWLGRFLSFCKEAGMIKVESKRRYTLITILNYEAYNPLNAVTETVTDAVTETGSETEQKGERGSGNRKGEDTELPPVKPFPEIPNETEIQSFCAEYRDLGRGVTRGIGEVWWRAWLASLLRSSRTFPREWKRALKESFTADLVAHYPKAIKALDGVQGSGRLAGGPAGSEKKTAPEAGGRTVAQARFELSRELEQVQERLDAAHDANLEPSATDLRREKELKAELASIV